MTKLCSSLLLLTLCTTLLLGQSDTEHRSNILSPITTMFEAMRSNDSTDLHSLFDKNATLITVEKKPTTNEIISRHSTIEKFITAVGTPHNQVWDERILSYDVKQDGPFATVWTPYQFYLGDSMLHCGINQFNMIQAAPDKWRIMQITDTRRKENCIDSRVSDINRLMDAWHHAAATADEDAFFGAMTADGVYIGTDASERWTRDEMRALFSDIFERDTAWAFTPLSREVTFSDDGTVAWIDELLDTWMNTCRSSAVLVQKQGKWKIRHYHLSIAVPNELVKSYLDLFEKN